MTQDRIIPIPIGQLDPDPSQPRRSFPEEDLRGLGQTLVRGQIDPIHVRAVGSRYQIIHGERRWRAATLMGLPTVAAMVIDPPPDDTLLLEAQLVSNIQRESLNPMDQAHAIDRLVKSAGTTAARVAVRLGKSPAQVSKLLSLLLLPAEVQSQIADGKLAAATGYEIAKVADPGKRAELTERALQGRLTRDAAASQGRTSPSARKAAGQVRRRNPRVVVPLGTGRSVTISGAEFTLASLIAWMGDLLARLTSARTSGMSLGEALRSLPDGNKETQCG